ncbi:Lon protease, partial [Dissostichus eleginoides]
TRFTVKTGTMPEHLRRKGKGDGGKTDGGRETQTDWVEQGGECVSVSWVRVAGPRRETWSGPTGVSFQLGVEAKKTLKLDRRRP